MTRAGRGVGVGGASVGAAVALGMPGEGVAAGGLEVEHAAAASAKIATAAVASGRHRTGEGRRNVTAPPDEKAPAGWRTPVGAAGAGDGIRTRDLLFTN